MDEILDEAPGLTKNWLLHESADEKGNEVIKDQVNIKYGSASIPN